MADNPQEPQRQEEVIPVTTETIGGSLIDSARISVMAASALLPVKRIILANEDPRASVHACLDQAMNWLDMARELTIEDGAPVTSVHIVKP